MKMTHNFEAYDNSHLIFVSSGHWLYPILEFEAFLKETSRCAETLEIGDKIIGRAAALLLVRLGVKRIHAGLLSERGKEILDVNAVTYSYDKLVAKIGCQTEDILKEEYDMERAYSLILERIKAREQGDGQ